MLKLTSGEKTFESDNFYDIQDWLDENVEDYNDVDICTVHDEDFLNDVAVGYNEIDDTLNLLSEYDDMADYQKAAVNYLAETQGYNLDEVYRKYEDVNMFDGRIEEYAEEYIDELHGDADEFMLRYFDYEKFANDLEIGGDCYEMYFGGQYWTVTNAHEN